MPHEEQIVGCDAVILENYCESLKDLPHEEEIVGCDVVLRELGQRRLTIKGGIQHH
jgi:hypothetical protein